MRNSPSASARPGHSAFSRVTSNLLVGCVALALSATFFALLHFANEWRIYHFPHTTAVVKQIREGIYRNSRDGRHLYAIGELVFTRTHHGRSYHCDEDVDLGSYPSAYAAGQQIDIVPRTGTCWHPLVVKMVDDWQK